MDVGNVGLLAFQNDTDKAEGGLMLLFFGFVFSVAPPLEIFLPTFLVRMGLGCTAH